MAQCFKGALTEGELCLIIGRHFVARGVETEACAYVMLPLGAFAVALFDLPLRCLTPRWTCKTAAMRITNPNNDAANDQLHRREHDAQRAPDHCLKNRE